MSKLLERWKREKAEKEERKRERERKRLEREAEKKRIAKEKRRKNKIRAKNRRAYRKHRQKELREHRLIGDIQAYHIIIITKNRKKIKNMGCAWWRSNAMNRYNELIEQNRAEVKFPVRLYETNEKKQKQSKRSEKVKYEILVIQKITGDEDNVTHFRNEQGMIVENYIGDNKSYKIVAKDEWYVDETFNVYGYHPSTDRKNFDFILNELVLKGLDKYSIKRIFCYKHRVIIQKDDDFDFVTCKTTQEAERLYDTLMEYVGKNKDIIFSNRLSRDMSSWILNEMEQKTGWSRGACMRIHSL